MNTAPEGPATKASIDQPEIIDYLSKPGAFGLREGEVLRLDTHGAHVFVAGDLAIKIKRKVRYTYLDFSTLELRHQALLREFEINHRFTPEIYLDVKPITRTLDGLLHVGGEGEAVEWALVMRRFEQSALLSEMARAGLPTELLKQLADEVHRSHVAAPVHHIAGGADRVGHIAQEVHAALAETWKSEADTLHAGLMARLTRSRAVIEQRAAEGFVRRCHGDLHLGNIVMWQGRPRLFDALEFDESLATIDTLYDLAFLLMDLDARATPSAANLVFNRYLWRSNARLDLEWLAAMPVFLALRAGIRAMTALQRAAAQSNPKSDDSLREARRYLDLALTYVAPQRTVLVAVGGLSGTGKSTLAAVLAPLLGSSPGALHLRSDLERKSLFDADELDRLPQFAYGQSENRRVYDVLIEKAGLGLAAQHSVISDAVYSAACERANIEAVATRAGIPFIGLWLEASSNLIMERVRSRTNDASDATVDVVASQLTRGVGQHGWTVVDAGGRVEQTRDAAVSAIKKLLPDAIVPERLQRYTA